MVFFSSEIQLEVKVDVISQEPQPPPLQLGQRKELAWMGKV